MELYDSKEKEKKDRIRVLLGLFSFVQREAASPSPVFQKGMSRVIEGRKMSRVHDII